jgi:hypothetical protein
LLDINNNVVRFFNNNVEVGKFLDINKTTVGRYIKSGRLWLNQYYIVAVPKKDLQ